MKADHLLPEDTGLLDGYNVACQHPAREEIQLQGIITESEFRDMKQAALTTAILKAFNTRAVVSGYSAFTVSYGRGHDYSSKVFLLGSCNKVPELKRYEAGQPIARALYPFTPGTSAEISGPVNITDPFYGENGSYVLNVPVGQYAKAWSGNTPLLYGEGTHVIHDDAFRFDSRSGLVAQGSEYINHETLHILRVPVGSIAKARLNGKYLLLAGRSEPYVYTTPNFKLTQANDRQLFHSADEQIIVHGPIKRLMPRTGEIILSYFNDKLIVYRQGLHVIKEPTHTIIPDFITTSLRTYEFPSQETITKRTAENPDADRADRDHANYQVLKTSDSLQIGVKVMVAFEIEQPEVTFRSFKTDQHLLKHIEDTALVAMSAAVQHCNSSEFLAAPKNIPSASTKGKEEKTVCQEELPTPSAPPFEHAQHEAQEKLEQNLNEYGVKIKNFAIVESRILNPSIESSIQEQAVLAAKTNAKQSTIAQESALKRTEAAVAAEVANMAATQRNKELVLEAQAKLDAAKIEAEAIKLQAKTKQETKALSGATYHQHPGLLDLAKLDRLSTLFRGATLTMTGNDMAGMVSGAGVTTPVLPISQTIQRFGVFPGGGSMQPRMGLVSSGEFSAQVVNQKSNKDSAKKKGK